MTDSEQSLSLDVSDRSQEENRPTRIPDSSSQWQKRLKAEHTEHT